MTVISNGKPFDLAFENARTGTEDREAWFSIDKLYRYSLQITWAKGPKLTVIGLNPSTADALNDDPTIRRCKGFAKSYDCGSLLMLNVFAYRSTDYKQLFQVVDPVGHLNAPSNLVAGCLGSKYTIAAWGQHSDKNWPYRDQPKLVADLIPELHCFRQSKHGHPEHPLYLPKTLVPVPFKYGAA